MPKANQCVIAIDGPAGAGKSTVARLVAQRLKYIYIDTGAMYRAITYLAREHGLTPLEEQKIGELACRSLILFRETDNGTRVLANDCDVTEAIRNAEVTSQVSVISQIAAVREAMLNQQRRMACDGGVVMDGRDIGTRVLPNAEVKIFLTASPEERAQRRWLELHAKGLAVSLEQITAEIRNRDKMDTERELDPLVPAQDAVKLDTTGLSIERVVEGILTICKERASFCMD